MATLKELSKKDELLAGGHRLCAGCGASIVVRQILLAAGKNTIATCSTGCLEVATSIYPFPLIEHVEYLSNDISYSFILKV